MTNQDNEEKESGTRVGTKIDSRETDQQSRPDSSEEDVPRVGTKIDSRESENKSKEDESSSEPPDTMRG